MNDRADVWVDYYESAYGPTIRVDTQSKSSALYFKDIFQRLAESQSSEIEMRKMAQVRLTNLKDIILRRVPDGQAGLRTLVLLQNTAKGPVFAWSRDSEGWLECADKVNRLIEKGLPEHQYLSLEDTDDALVEFAYWEKRQIHPTH